MPTRFDNANRDNANGSGLNTAVVAWLSLADAADGGGFRAALFLTTDDGEPVGFCFTRAFPRRPSERGDGTGASVAAHVLEQLLQAAQPPSLILGLQSEAPGDAMAAGDSRIPLCLLADDIGLADVDSERGANGQAGVLWQSQPPQVGSVARRLLDEVLEWDDSLEPFRRAADGLNVAFADENVSGLMNARGLATVVSLDTPAGSRNHPAAAVSISERGNTAERPEATLAQRLWAVLRNPLGSPRGVRLQWRGELMPFQADGVRALMENPACCSQTTWVSARPYRLLSRCGCCALTATSRRLWSSLRRACWTSGVRNSKSGRRSLRPSSYEAQRPSARGNGKPSET